MMADDNQFNGVACCVDDKSDFETLTKLLGTETQSSHKNIVCHNLDLSNKYYKATVRLFDSTKLTGAQLSILEESHAVILYGDGMTITEERLRDWHKQMSSVRGDPRLLLCHGLSEECETYRTLNDWCIKNGYALFLTTEENITKHMIDSLSANRWSRQASTEEVDPRSNNAPTSSNGGDGSTKDDPHLDEGLMKKMIDFDSLLHKLSAYRDNPELRGNPDDQNIEEIAELLSGLLGDDNDNFLAEDD